MCLIMWPCYTARMMCAINQAVCSSMNHLIDSTYMYICIYSLWPVSSLSLSTLTPPGHTHSLKRSWWHTQINDRVSMEDFIQTCVMIQFNKPSVWHSMFYVVVACVLYSFIFVIFNNWFGLLNAFWKNQLIIEEKLECEWEFRVCLGVNILWLRHI